MSKLFKKLSPSVPSSQDTLSLRIMRTLTRIRWAARATLAFGVIASGAANVLHAEPNPISRVISAWPPLALLLTVELISRVPVHHLWMAIVRLAATGLIAGVAAWISYWHMASVTANYGETGTSAYMLPLTVDGLVVVASISLVELNARIRDLETKPAPSPVMQSVPVMHTAPVMSSGPVTAAFEASTATPGELVRTNGTRTGTALIGTVTR